MNQIHKEYGHSFVLEPTKLTRLVDTMHERLGDRNSSGLHDVFEVFFNGDRHEELTSLDQVLSLDNSRREKIKRLVIQCSTAHLSAERPEHEVTVDFAGPSISTTTGNTARVVAISVRSDATGWASRTLSEVEEQIERTWSHHVPAMLLLVGLLVIAGLILASQFLTVRVAPASQGMWLSDSDLGRVEVMLREHPTLTDQDLRQVLSMQLRNVLADRRPPRVDGPKFPGRICS